MALDEREQRLRVSLYQAATKLGFRDENDAIRAVTSDAALRDQLVLDADGNATNALEVLGAFVAHRPHWLHGADMNSVLRRGQARGPSVPLDAALSGADAPPSSADGGARGTGGKPPDDDMNQLIRDASRRSRGQ